MDDADGWGSPWADDTATAATAKTPDDSRDGDTAKPRGDPWADSFGATSAWAAAAATEELPDWAAGTPADLGRRGSSSALWPPAAAAADVKRLAPDRGNGLELWGAAASTHLGGTAVREIAPNLDLARDLQMPLPPLVVEEAEWGALADVREDAVEPGHRPNLELDVGTPTPLVAQTDGPSLGREREVGLDSEAEADADRDTKKSQVEEAAPEGAREEEEKEKEKEEVVKAAEEACETTAPVPTSLGVSSPPPVRERGGSNEGSEKDRDNSHSGPPATAITADTDVEMPPSSDAIPDRSLADTQVSSGQSSHVDDDDFGDFAEEAEFDDFVGDEPEVPPEARAPPPSEGVPAFEIDTSLVHKLYPIPTSSPDPPPVEDEMIHTTGARKAWYRLTQDGTLRKKNAADDDDYVRVTWPGSRVQGEVHKIVAKWLSETRNTGRRGRKNAQNLSSMFGWGGGTSSSPIPSEANKRLSLGAPKTTPGLQTHSRHSSDSGKRTLPLNTSTVSSSMQPPSIPSPLSPHFGWASSSNQPPPPAKPSASGRDSPFERTSFDAPALSAANSPPTSRRVSSTLGRGSTQNSPVAASCASSAKAGTPPTPKTAQDLVPEPPAKDGAPPAKQAISRMDDWGSFDSFDKSPTPNQAASVGPQSACQPLSDDWSAFEALVSSNPPKATTPLPHDADGGWAAFESIKPTSPPALPSGPASPISSRNSTVGSRPDSVVGTKKLAEIPKPLPPASEATKKPLPPQPPPLSIGIDNDRDAVCDDGGGDDDDGEWGEMQSPTKSLDTTSRVPTPVPMSLPSHSTSSMAPATGADIFSGLGVFAATSTPTANRSVTPVSGGSLFDGLDAFSTKIQTDATGTPSNGTAFGFGGLTTTTSTTAAPAPDNWDLSFFDKPSQPPPPPPPPAAAQDLWDAPAPAVPTKGKKEKEEDEIVKKIIDRLPDLSYMLV